MGINEIFVFCEKLMYYCEKHNDYAYETSNRTAPHDQKAKILYNLVK